MKISQISLFKSLKYILGNYEGFKKVVMGIILIDLIAENQPAMRENNSKKNKSRKFAATRD
jgi:hypothetical protein